VSHARKELERIANDLEAEAEELERIAAMQGNSLAEREGMHCRREAFIMRREPDRR
jgi:hypothetical protein